MSLKEKLIEIVAAHSRVVPRLVTFGIGLAIIAALAIVVVGGADTVQEAFAMVDQSETNTQSNTTY